MADRQRSRSPRRRSRSPRISRLPGQKALTGEQMKTCVKNNFTGDQLLQAYLPGFEDPAQLIGGFRETFRFGIYCELPDDLQITRNNIPVGPIALTEKIADSLCKVRGDFYNMRLEDIGDTFLWEKSFIVSGFHSLLYNHPGDECPICYDDIAEGTGVDLQCGHGFHRECIATVWAAVGNPVAHPCPVCRNTTVLDPRVNTTFQRRRRSRSKSRRKKRRTKRKKR